MLIHNLVVNVLEKVDSLEGRHQEMLRRELEEDLQHILNCIYSLSKSELEDQRASLAL